MNVLGGLIDYTSYLLDSVAREVIRDDRVYTADQRYRESFRTYGCVDCSVHYSLEVLCVLRSLFAACCATFSSLTTLSAPRCLVRYNGKAQWKRLTCKVIKFTKRLGRCCSVQAYFAWLCSLVLNARLRNNSAVPCCCSIMRTAHPIR